MSTTAILTDYRYFLEEIAAAEKRVLLLDYDGTIAPFSRDRRCAFPYPEIPGLLRRIMTECDTRLIMVSDRIAQELPPLLGITPLPEIWGNHGLQRIYPDGHYEEEEVDGAVLQAVAQAEADLAMEGLAHLTESKLASVAVHWRGLQPSSVLEIRTKAYRVLEPLAFRTGLLLTEFDGGIGFRLRSANKGRVVCTLLSEIGPEVPIAYVGDDITDEDAFRALNGRGLTMRVGPKQRFSAAQSWLREPRELFQFLNEWIRACGGKQ